MRGMGLWSLSPSPIARGIQPEAPIDLPAVEALEREPRAHGLDRLQLIADGLEIAGVNPLEDPLQMLADLPRDRVAAFQERPRASRVFRRSCTPSADADRIPPLRFLRKPEFDPDLVLPRVAQVVLIKEPLVESEPEVGESDLACILGRRESADSTDAIVAAVDAKPVEMEITPAESDLEHVMEVGEGAIAAHQEPPPDHGADLPDPGMELVDLGRGLIGHGPG